MVGLHLWCIQNVIFKMVKFWFRMGAEICVWGLGYETRMGYLIVSPAVLSNFR